MIGSSFICGGYILFCNHPLSNNRNAGCCPAVDFGCCFLYLVSLGKVCGLCRLLNPQIIVYSLQFRFGLALGNEHLFRKHCIYHLYDFVFTRQPYLLCQFSACLLYTSIPCVSYGFGNIGVLNIIDSFRLCLSINFWCFIHFS